MIVLRRRRVRIHQADPGPTIEGILVGSLDSHYRLLRPTLLEAPGRSYDLKNEVWVPRERVLFIERV